MLLVALAFSGGSVTTYLIQYPLKTLSAPNLNVGEPTTADRREPNPTVAANPESPQLPLLSSPALPSFPEGAASAGEPGVKIEQPDAAILTTAANSLQPAATEPALGGAHEGSTAPPVVKDLLPIQALAEKGKSLTKIISQHYPAANRMVLDAIVLANPEVDSENVIHPGQIINLPKIDFQGKTVQLQDGLLYALYGSYYSVASWNGDKPWLEKNQVRFLVRVTREASGRKIYRIFLGGYEKLTDLQEAQKGLRIKSKRARLSRREDVSKNITSPPGKNEEGSDNLPYRPEKPAPVTAGTESGPPMEPARPQIDRLGDSGNKAPNLAAIWLKFLTFTQPAAELAVGQNPHEVESIDAEPSADQEAAISKTFLARDCSDGGAGVAENSSQEPASETGLAKTQLGLVREAPRPAEIHPSVAYAFQVLKIQSAVVGSLKRHWEAQGSRLAGWWRHFKSFSQEMLSAWAWSPGDELALLEIKTGEGEKTAVPSLTKEVSPSREDPLAEVAENPFQEPPWETWIAKAPPDLGEAAPRPAEIHPPGPYAYQVLKVQSAVVGSLKRHWEAQGSHLAGWWRHFLSLVPMVPAYAWSPRNEADLEEINTGEGEKIPVSSLAQESSPSREESPLATPEPVALANASPINIRRYLDAGGVFRIETQGPRGPNAKSSEPYVEPTPVALGAYLASLNGVRPPTNDKMKDSQPGSEGSCPGGEQAPSPAPPEQVLLPEGTVRRYRGANGVWHIVNREPKNPLHSSGTALADAGPEVNGFSEKPNESQPPADSRGGRAGPPRKVSWPADEPGPLAPPEPKAPDKALFPEGTVRRYRGANGVWHIVNGEPKNPLHSSGTTLAAAGPGVSGASEKSIEIRRRDGAKVNPGSPLRQVSWPGDKPDPLAPSESRPPEKALLAEGTIRRYRDAKGVLHIESVEYPKPAPWPRSLRLARNMASVPRSTAEAGPLLQQLSTQQVVTFKDQKGRLHIGNPDLEDLARKGAQELNRASLEPIIIEAAFSYGLPVPLVQALIKVESNFVPWAVSPKGAIGLMQLMPGTATFLGVQDPFSPRENIMGGCRYLRLLLDCFSENLTLALAAYNAGYQRVINAGYRVPEISETQNFVTEVISRYYTLVLARRPSGV